MVLVKKKKKIMDKKRSSVPSDVYFTGSVGSFVGRPDGVTSQSGPTIGANGDRGSACNTDGVPASIRDFMSTSTCNRYDWEDER